MTKKKYQVIIAGAGPAGLATSLVLSAYNITHCIIDKNTIAKQKLGDALPPNAKPLLKQLGILQLLNSSKHIPYYGNKSIWGSNILQQKEFIKETNGHGYLLDRLHFENQLRQLVQNNKTPFYNGYQIKKVNQLNNNVEIGVQKKTEHKTLRAQYIIDATGKKASICRHFNVAKIELDNQITIAFQHQLPKPISREIWIEATENGWWYIAPNASHQVNCMFFTLKELIPSKAEIVSFLKNELINTLEIQQIIKPLEKELENHKLMNSGTSYLKQPYGKNWLAVGDAAFSYDPISSYGITSALASGYYGGHAIASKLANERDAFTTYQYVLENGVKTYLQKLIHQYQMEQRWSNSYYWKNRLLDTNKLL